MKRIKSSELQPKYLKTYEDGLLIKKAVQAKEILKTCTLCPRNCRVDRTANLTGICKTGIKAVVASYHPHFGEEAPLVGEGGSGTIFFTHCNLMCCFCQNYDISHEGVGKEVTADELANFMLRLQNMGCENINFVSPSHVVPQILDALLIAIENGLKIPLVYNSGGYDSIDTIKILDGVIDIYMPDFKFWDDSVAFRTCKVQDYLKVVSEAIKEMYRQVGDLIIDEFGIARRGLLVRHLVLPNNLAGTRSVMRFLAREISTQTYVNIMAQYHPCGDIAGIPELGRRITSSEYSEALKAAQEEGITRLDQPFSGKILRFLKDLKFI